MHECPRPRLEPTLTTALAKSSRGFNHDTSGLKKGEEVNYPGSSVKGNRKTQNRRVYLVFLLMCTANIFYEQKCKQCSRTSQ